MFLLSKPKKIFFSTMMIALFATPLVGCSVETSFTPLNPQSADASKEPTNPVGDVSSGSFGVVGSGGSVTTSNGYKIKANIGSITQKKITSNGYVIQGVFHE